MPAAFIDNGVPGTWADEIRFPPWIESGDGTAFNAIFQLSQHSLSDDAHRLEALITPVHAPENARVEP